MASSSGSVANREMGYDTSTRIDQKRGHQWFMDTSEQELFFNKKQAIESVKDTSGAAVMNNSLWRDSSCSQAGVETGNGLFRPKPVRISNISDKNVPSIFSGVVNMEKKNFENQMGSDSPICLNMSHALEHPLCPNTGQRKVKVNEVRISENCLPQFVGNSFCLGDKNKVMSTTYERTGGNMFPGPTHNTADGNTISAGPAFSKIDKNYLSVGQASNQYYNGIDNNMLSIGQAFNRGNYNVNTVREQYEKENGNFMPIGPTYSKGHGNFFAVDPFYNKLNETFMSSGSSYNKGDTDIGIRCQKDATVASLQAAYHKVNSSILSTAENCKKGEQTTISFGGFQDNPKESDPSGTLNSSNDILPSSGPSGGIDSAEQLSSNAVAAATSRTDGSNKNKKPKTKKGSSNNFPANVKILLSTGILDGVPVKYVSWSREKNLRGVVKGTGYLCSCDDCKLSKAINAYEFECHAGCKTKHPTNHIYFENGKTIYAVVQELKSTPQEMLFEVIQNLTGSPINQKNFSTWKTKVKDLKLSCAT